MAWGCACCSGTAAAWAWSARPQSRRVGQRIVRRPSKEEGEDLPGVATRAVGGASGCGTMVISSRDSSETMSL
ncbi:hypothetical protein PR202_ga12379 [Eleusine coracana subsp. coracana]|uniref:Secreted protein n=1 Tax=Eleusine coracana subsp. coracana TaxID=191504 RepID=A0AAV5CBE1_ELECO|nr:hypothetical protein PR202_ga12379 [Eleusine coracana subsp. coracana]